MTYSLGYVMARSPRFVAALVKALGGNLPAGDGVVRLQDRDDDGRTDVELEVGSNLSIIFEAKRGSALPSEGQLRRYAQRLNTTPRTFSRLVAVTNAPPAYARASLPAEIDGVPVAHLSWREIRGLVAAARDGETNHNKRLLGEFSAYLMEILGMETARSNLVYVLSLGAGGAWGLNFKEVALKQRRYFYPVGKNWPPPPNYLAFRYDGRLQSIHHVEAVEIFDNPKSVFPTAANAKIKPHYLFTLGVPIEPQHEVRNGPKIIRSMRVWCEIDTLLTCSTITEALELTKKRHRASG